MYMYTVHFPKIKVLSNNPFLLNTCIIKLDYVV